jgi:hypothetical protein
MSSIQDRINALKKSQGENAPDKPRGPSSSTAASKVGAGAASKFGGGTPKCYICEKSVFKVEELKALDRVYHKSCFRCSGKAKNGCEKVLSLTDYVDRKGDDGTKEPYCRSCYNKLYAPKGMNSAAGMSMDDSVSKIKKPESEPEAKKVEAAAPPKAPAVTAEKEKDEKKPEGERRMSISERLAALKASQGSTAAARPPVGGVASVASKFGGGTLNKVAEAISKPAPAPAPAPKEEPPKEEPPKEEAPKVEPPKMEPPKAQPPKEEPPKEEPSNEEPPKEEPPKEEPPKEEPPKEEPPKAEAPKVEPLKMEPPKAQPPKEETPKEEPPKEAPKKEEPPKEEEKKEEKPALASKAEPSKEETPKEEEKKGEPGKRISGRVSGGLAARMGGLDLSKVGMLGAGPRASLSGSIGEGSSSGKESPPKDAKTTSNVADGDDGKVEVDNAMSRAAVKKGGRKAPTKKKFKIENDDD